MNFLEQLNQMAGKPASNYKEVTVVYAIFKKLKRNSNLLSLLQIIDFRFTANDRKNCFSDVVLRLF